MSRLFQAGEIHNAVLKARLHAASRIATVAMALVDTHTIRTALRASDRDIRKRQAVLEVARNSGAQSIVRERELRNRVSLQSVPPTKARKLT